ncbi:conserved hypothetical protein [Gluconacetobacter diazotrophicus PA1 5]|uniref:DUF218 domain-containing protein n=1 Tax=Gluconacetobacter diazotrophicus (strain ATCC 49037 / DSM 5601 / CCUG 37298 / CIP 103539 / LMG 7603 / PAl5) TaxID=272568 RepID=A9H1D5_GLUDA|nr:conserved hypothetical protein [Gluconacetobacter diazotrophicus PA1 5]
MYGALAGLLAFGLLWGAGFAWFFRDALRPPAMPPIADGIVALTGGQGRIEASLRLLAQGRGRQLLISGVAPHATTGSVASRLQPQGGGDGIPAALWRHVTLGRHATSTIGNADETAEWAHANAIHSLIVVTAGYHIRRATMEIRRTVPGIVLYPYPIQPPALQAPLRVASVRLMATEYDKWIMASLGLTRDMDGYGR